MGDEEELDIGLGVVLWHTPHCLPTFEQIPVLVLLLTISKQSQRFQLVHLTSIDTYNNHD